MRVLIILAIVLAALFLLSRARIGGHARYDETGLALKLRFGVFRIQLYPAKTKKAKAPTEPKQTEPPAQKNESGRGGNFALVKELLPVIAEATGRLKQKIRIDFIRLHLVWGSQDAVACALGYGYANVALGMIWPLLEHNFNIKSSNITTGVDFQAAVPTLYADAALTMTLGQCMILGIGVAIKALKIYLNHKKEITMKEAESV